MYQNLDRNTCTYCIITQTHSGTHLPHYLPDSSTSWWSSLSLTLALLLLFVIGDTLIKFSDSDMSMSRAHSSQQRDGRHVDTDGMTRKPLEHAW